MERLWAKGSIQRQAMQPHAEVFALNDAGTHTENATAYVSLEPCNHYGRTPPRTEAMIRAKVKHVVVGMVDPNPIVASKGVERLRGAGIEVTVGVEEELCRKLNEAYIHRMLTGKPFVTLRWKEEEKMKEQAREQLEALAKSKEDMIIPKAESDFQRYQDVILRLEKEIAQLRLKTDSFKIAALHCGTDVTDVTYAFRLTNGKSIPAVKETGPHYVSEIVDFHGDVARDRECVMCFSDEMSFVFLP